MNVYEYVFPYIHIHIATLFMIGTMCLFCSADHNHFWEQNRLKVVKQAATTYNTLHRVGNIIYPQYSLYWLDKESLLNILYIYFNNIDFIDLSREL